MRSTSLEVLEVALAELDRDRCRGRNLDRPRSGDRSDGGSLRIAGWVLGRGSRATEVEVLSGEELVGRTIVEVERPDLASAFEGASEARTAGFRIDLKADGEGKSELLVRAVLDDGARIPIGRIRVGASLRDVRGTGRSSAAPGH